MNPTKELKEVFGIQEMSGKNRIHLKFLLDVGRELTDKDNSNISDCMYKLRDLLSEESLKLDPKFQNDMVEERENILNLFDGHSIYVEEIPNGYSDMWYFKHRPWFVVTTKLGHFEIGWRKSVIQIDWSRTTIQGKSKELFPDENVTREDKYIHAWGYENAQRYINTLLNTK